MKKALVTGISGFAGSFLAELLLEQGYEVHGTHISDDVKNLDHIKDKLHLHKLNLLDKSDVEKYVLSVSPDVIFHLAALTSPAESFKEPEKVFTNNIAAQIHLLETVRQNSISPRILIIGSAEEYGMISPDDLPINEKTELRPGSPYAVSKIAQDFLALQYFLSYGMDIVRVRPFNHIGPRQAPAFVVASFAKQIVEIENSKATKIQVGNLDAKRDFTDVRDMVKAYLLLSEKGQSGEVYNVGSGKSYRIGDILDMLSSLSTAKIEIEVDPARLRPSDTPDIRSSNHKIESETGWRPEISIEQTLKDTLDYFRQNV